MKEKGFRMKGVVRHWVVRHLERRRFSIRPGYWKAGRQRLDTWERDQKFLVMYIWPPVIWPCSQLLVVIDCWYEKTKKT
jgi:hypothetical protein